MNTIKIPKSFMLFGQTINVEVSDTLMFEDNSKGQAHHPKNKIFLQRRGKEHLFAKEDVEQTYYHETVHFMFNKIGEYELSKNEKLVDLLGSMLHQIAKTQKGETKI